LRIRTVRTGRSAFWVALGIVCSRLTGLVRQRLIAQYFGLAADADAWSAGFRIPNFLQNLFGEGALSASFIPVYAALVARGDRRAADRVAGAVGALLGLVVAAIVLVGVVATPAFIVVVAPGFTGATRDLTVQLVRVLFPGAGLLVLSAWCLGILNSHHRFLLSYAAPMAWNSAMIVTLLVFGGRTSSLPQLAVILAWGSVVGSALQFAVQIPTVRRLAPDLRFVPDLGSEDLRTVVRNFLPALVSRGVVQVSAYVDTLIASLLSTGAVAGLTNAQSLYTLPVSLFGISVSAAELPAMAGLAGVEGRGARSAVDASGGGSQVDAGGRSADPPTEALRRRLDNGLRQIAFFVVPSAMAFLAFGDVLAGALLQGGRFGHVEAVYVWRILAGSAIGLLASTLGRLYGSAYYALRDTRTPLRYAVIRVVLTTGLGYLFAIELPPRLGISGEWSAAGLTASAGIAGWVEFLLLRATLSSRIGRTGLPVSYVVRLWSAAAIGAALGWTVKLVLIPRFPPLHPIVIAIVVLGPYGLTFFGIGALIGVEEVSTGFDRLVRGTRRMMGGQSGP
jgi:putative peptidoglycan lipid II flippase